MFVTDGNLIKQARSELVTGAALSDILYLSDGMKFEKPVRIKMPLQSDLTAVEDMIPIVFRVANNRLTAYALAYETVDGQISFETDESGSFQIFFAKESVLDEIVTSIPDKFALSQNYPNPFNSSTNIRYQLPQTADVQILIFDLMGHRVRSYYQGVQSPGYYTIEWNGLSDDQCLVPSGVYFYRMVSSDFQATEKMIYLK